MLPAVVRPAMPRAAMRPVPPTNLPPLRAVRLLDQLRERVRMLHYSRRTEQAYLYWSRAFIRFHGLRHPAEMGGPEVEAYLTYLASDRGLSSPLLCDPSASGWKRHPHRAGIAWARRCCDDHDLHARAPIGRQCRAQPSGRSA